MYLHVTRKRLFEVATEEARFTEPEFVHVEKCSECLEFYGKSILEIARIRAKQKTENPQRRHRSEVNSSKQQ